VDSSSVASCAVAEAAIPKSSTVVIILEYRIINSKGDSRLLMKCNFLVMRII